MEQPRALTNAGAIDESAPADEWWTDAVTATPAARRRPSVASRHDERGDLPNQPRRSQQPGVDVFLFRCRPELGTSECVRLVKPARAVEEARRHDEHGGVTNHPDANPSDVFLIRPYNAQNEPRASAP